MPHSVTLSPWLVCSRCANGFNTEGRMPLSCLATVSYPLMVRKSYRSSLRVERVMKVFSYGPHRYAMCPGSAQSPGRSVAGLAAKEGTKQLGKGIPVKATLAGLAASVPALPARARQGRNPNHFIDKGVETVRPSAKTQAAQAPLRCSPVRVSDLLGGDVRVSTRAARA